MQIYFLQKNLVTADVTKCGDNKFLRQAVSQFYEKLLRILR